MKTAVELREIADECEERGLYTKAARLHKKALLNAERTYGKDTSEMIPFLYNMGMISLALDNGGEAKGCFNRLLELFASVGASAEDVEEAQQLLLDLDESSLAANA